MAHDPDDKSRSPKILLALLVLLLILTIAYSYFVYFSTQAIYTIITDSNTNPSLLFNIFVKPYVVWIIISFALFLYNIRCYLKSIKQNIPESFVLSSLIQVVWLLAGGFLHLVAIFSPFLTQSYILQ